ncbi:hypothetical protein J0J29_23425, partial [Vibrio vulnificus]|uniref:hypothetical protein n=1 Tax=Vibrio vulnificus TaxID=672 RepID=UPI0019D4E946
STLARKMLRLSRILRQQAASAAATTTTAPVTTTITRLDLLKKQVQNDKEHFQKTQFYFPKHYIKLHLPSVINPTRQVQFYIPLEMTKVELK